MLHSSLLTVWWKFLVTNKWYIVITEWSIQVWQVFCVFLPILSQCSQSFPLKLFQQLQINLPGKLFTLKKNIRFTLKSVPCTQRTILISTLYLLVLIIFSNCSKEIWIFIAIREAGTFSAITYNNCAEVSRHSS